MNLLRRFLAVICGVAILGAATISGRMADQFGPFFHDFGMEIPALTGAFVKTPFFAYVLIGSFLGLIVGGVMWIVRPAWISFLIAASVGICLFVFLVVFTSALMAPLPEDVHDLSTWGRRDRANQALEQTRDSVLRYG